MVVESTVVEELKEVLEDSRVYAALIFGSFARGEENYNDIDVAVFTEGDIDDLVAKVPGVFDVSRFSDLPMNIRHRVLDEGELIYCSDEDRYYDETISFAKAYEDFRPIYEEYLRGVKARG